jgi:hypothetical protein
VAAGGIAKGGKARIDHSQVEHKNARTGLAPES